MMFTKPLTRAPRDTIIKSFLLAIGWSYFHDLSHTFLKRLKLLIIFLEFAHPSPSSALVVLIFFSSSTISASKTNDLTTAAKKGCEESSDFPL